MIIQHRTQVLCFIYITVRDHVPLFLAGDVRPHMKQTGCLPV